MSDFLAGALFTMSLVASLYFYRFWRDTRDLLFLYFGAAFGLFAVHWASLVVVPSHMEAEHRVYWLRLAAFLLLLTGIVHKNRRERRLR